MTTLVMGATGATGRLLVRQLLERGEEVRAVVRSRERLSADLREHERLQVVEAAVLDLDEARRAELVAGCGAIGSCLGHPMSLRGVFGPPRRLVTDTARRLYAAVEASRPARPVRFALMCSSGVRDRGLHEPRSLGERAVIGLLRLLVPPHADNEDAAELLRTTVGRGHPALEWAAVRPDTLHDAEAPSPYELHPSPTRSPIFDAGRTSRVNVAHFMARLLSEDELWREWRGRMPVIYDAAR